MPVRRSRNRTPEDAAIANFNASFDALTKRSAASLGQPPGTKPVGDAEKVRQWGIRDQKVDRAQLLAQLLTTGVSPEMLDPSSPDKLEVVKAAPDLAPLYAQPAQDHEQADILSGFAEWPFRYGLLAPIDDDEERVKEAERLSKLHDEKTSAAMEAHLAEQEKQAKAAPPTPIMPPVAPPSEAPMAPQPAPAAPTIQMPTQMMGG